MSTRLACTIAVVLFAASAAGAETLPLPNNLTGFDSAAGEQLLIDADAREGYFSLASNFVTQKNQAYCGVASIVMVLNSMKVPAPPVPEYEPYKTFTQDNVLNDQTDRVLARSVLMEIGMTLDQIAGVISTQPVKAEVHHAADSSLDEFRKAAVSHLKQSSQYVIVNYLRKAIQQEKGGHISPLAAYDAETDRFLILDVARYKYPPVWVKASELFDAMNTTDSDNNGLTRGYVLISKATTQ